MKFRHLKRISNHRTPRSSRARNNLQKLCISPAKRRPRCHGATWSLLDMSGRKVAKRACDGCKIRKIKCTEVSPCEGCITAGIACTFVKHPQTRGPRRLRKSALEEITQTQRQWADTGLTAAAIAVPNGTAATDVEHAL